MAWKNPSACRYLAATFCVLGSLVAGAVAAEAAGRKPAVLPFDEIVDWEACPTGYMALGNRRLMYPVTVDDWPLKIDSRRQLFVDDYLVSETKGLRREFHPPRKHPGNPILTAEKPWERGGICGVHKVVRDKGRGMFRMWYTLFRPPGRPMHEGLPLRLPLCYAESDDGVRWTRPNVGIVEIDGSRKNNILQADPTLGLMFEPQDPDPQRRYKGLFYHRAGKLPAEGLYLYTSPDGLRWKRQSDRCIIPVHEPKRTT